MAYSDYGAFVFKNGEREYSNEDCNVDGHLVHGLIEDEHIKVICYKQGLPTIYYDNEKISFYNEEEIDYYDFDSFSYDLNGYSFYFEDREKPYVVTVVCPNGDEWICEYDYWYGAGFDEEY